MITFGEIVEKTIRVKYEKNDIEGYSVEGYASYNKENKLNDAYGSVLSSDMMNSCDFNIYRNMCDNYRMNINNVNAGSGVEMNNIVESVLAELKATYPQL